MPGRGGIAFAVGTCVGTTAAIWPTVWLGLFGTDEVLIDTGVQYLRIVGPFHGFFALGLSLYFASQGAGRLKWPLLAVALRLVLYAGLGWIALAITDSLKVFFISRCCCDDTVWPVHSMVGCLWHLVRYTCPMTASRLLLPRFGRAGMVRR